MTFVESAPAGTEVTEVNAQFAGGTTVGDVRDDNQDRYALATFAPEFGNIIYRIGVVADGVGGMASGSWCASAAIAHFVAGVVGRLARQGPQTSGLQLRSIATEAIQDANRVVYARMKDKGATTLCAVISDSKGGVVGVHVGDSKIFRFDANRTFTQLTSDQTIASQLENLGIGKSGGLTPELKRSLAQYIGMSEPLKPQIIEISGTNDAFMLATDGIEVTRLASSLELWSRLARNAATSGALIARMLDLSNWLGSSDNTTVVVVGTRARNQTEATLPNSLSFAYGRKTAVVLLPLGEFQPTPTYKQEQPKEPKLQRGRRSRKGSEGKPSLVQKERKKTSPVVTLLPGFTQEENAPRNPQ